MDDTLTTPATTGSPSSDEDVAKPGRGARIVRALGWASITLGLLILGFVAHQLWVTTWLAQQNQNELAAEREAYFESAVVREVPYVGPGAPELAVDPETGEPPTILEELPPAEGEAFALITIPSIERLRDGWNVVEGVRVSDLKNGAGHMPGTAIPGQPGNAVISGHRTTYGMPFHELDLLEPGDVIEVTTAIGTHTYEVRSTEIVAPTDLWVIQSREGAWLTLTTCHPKWSARQRLVVFAEMVDGPNAEAISSS